MAGIYYFSIISNLSDIVPIYKIGRGTLLHFFTFFVLLALFYRSIENTPYKTRIIIAFFLTIIVAVSKEVLQIFIPNRAFSIGDILVDAGSALIAAIIIGISEWRRNCLMYQS